MSRKFLVATDLSERSARALQRALALASVETASIRLLHVIDDDQPAALIDAQRDKARQYLGQMVAREAGPGQTIEIVVEAGEAHTTINRQAQAFGADLIVLGAHRKNILLDLFRGTTIERVLQTGSTPVLVCNLPAAEPHDRVLAAVELNQNSIDAIEVAFDLGLVRKAKITVAHAYSSLETTQMAYAGRTEEEIHRQHSEKEADIADRLYHLVSGTQLGALDYALVIEEAVPAQLLIRIAGQTGTSLTIIGTRSSSSLERFFLGSVAKAVLRQGHGDILAVPPPAKPIP
ncbi:universal stress protein [Glycocaulis sp.]|uniref:universal stress protein n=1 Tax=Glycocaulis sp. TaxID=1969725 RepID=UPI003D21EFD9